MPRQNRARRGIDSAATLAAFAIAMLAIAGAGIAQTSKMTADESRIAAVVDARNSDALVLLERVVNINSGTHNLAGVRAVGRIFQSEFDTLGFQTRWVNEDAVGRAGHLVADHPGAGTRILLIGHLDTVFEPDSPFQKLEHLDRTTARGPGVIDMKGGDVSFSTR